MKLKEAAEIRPIDAAPSGETKGSKAPGSRLAPDRVSTGSAARLEAAASGARAQAAQGRAARLEAIEAAIRQGAFKPDPQRIADRILEEAELSAALRSMLGT